jgi:hypothetical protein
MEQVFQQNSFERILNNVYGNEEFQELFKENDIVFPDSKEDAESWIRDRLNDQQRRDIAQLFRELFEIDYWENLRMKR